MTKINEKTDILILNETIDVGEADNSIRVEDDDRGDSSAGWPKISLSSNKASLDSNGVDTAVITATCLLPGGIIPTIETRREETTPTETRKLSTRFWMTPGAEIAKIYLSMDGEEGDEVPVSSWFGREITVSEDLIRAQEYIIVYWGAYTVTFSVDQLSHIWPTSEVPVFNGIAETYLTSMAAGGGLAVVSGSFENADDNITIKINDIRVMRISVSPNPGSISLYETSEIIARVIAPDGFPVTDGMVVTFEVNSKGAVGTLSSATDTTSTDTITNELRWSSNEKTVSTQFPISSIISIKTEIGAYGEEYASGATFNGSTITLADGVGFDTPIVRVYITYKSGGIAKTTFSPLEQGEAIIFASAGQETAMCTVAVDIAGGGSSGSSTGGSGGQTATKVDGYKYLIEVEETFLPNDEITKMIVNVDFIALAGTTPGGVADPAKYWEYEIRSSDNCNVYVDPVAGKARIVGLGQSELVEKETWKDADDYLHGNILLTKVDIDTPTGKIKIRWYTMKIVWGEYGDMAGQNEVLEDVNGDGYVQFSKGRIGTHDVFVALEGEEYTEEEEITISAAQYWEAQEDMLRPGDYRWVETTFRATIVFWLKADEDKELSTITVDYGD